MSKSHEEIMLDKAENANNRAIQLARLQDCFLNQIKADMMSNDLTALDELFYQMLKVKGAIPLLIAYLPEGEQTQFVNLIDTAEPEL